MGFGCDYDFDGESDLGSRGLDKLLVLANFAGRFGAFDTAQASGKIKIKIKRERKGELPATGFCCLAF